MSDTRPRVTLRPQITFLANTLVCVDNRMAMAREDNCSFYTNVEIIKVGPKTSDEEIEKLREELRKRLSEASE